MEFSRSALLSNLDLLDRNSVDPAIDLRCDAYGHGADWVRDAARERGFVAFLTDDSPRVPIPASTHDLYGSAGGVRVGTLFGELIALKSIAAGETVSYGNTWTAQRSTQLGLVSLGFADGLPRAGSNHASMTVGGVSVPVVGRIAMDQSVVDLTQLTVAVGDSVSVWDTPESSRTWADIARRNPLSLLSGLSWRVERRWVA